MILIPHKYLLIFFFVPLCGCGSSPDAGNPAGSEASVNIRQPCNTLRVFCTEDQHHLTNQWMKGFQKDHSGIQPDILLYERSVPLDWNANGIIQMIKKRSTTMETSFRGLCGQTNIHAIRS
jgi:hypothetical protein